MGRTSFRHNQILRFEQMQEESSSAKGRKGPFPAMAPRFTMDQVVLPKDLRHELEEVVLLIRNRDLIYGKWGFDAIEPEPKFILSFYGPSGTGKTMCAHALASELGLNIMPLNYADIESKYVGDAPKNIVKAFKAAQEDNCVLFFDEADSFLGNRITNVSSSADQSVNSFRSQMLIQLEEFQGIVIFATNLVANYDFAFQTRILKNVHFRMPDDEQRQSIIKKMMPARLPLSQSFSDKEWKSLVKASKDFSGRDIKAAFLTTFAYVAREKGKDAIFPIRDFLTGFEKRQKEMKQIRK